MPRSRSPNERSYRDDHDRRRDRRSYRSTRSRSPPHRTTSSSSSRRRSRSRDRDYGREQERERSYGRASRPRDDDDREPSASASSSRREHNAGPVSKASQDKKETADEVAEPTGPNFGLSGKLAAETNTVKGVVLKYNEPPEARKPSKTWRLYVFKGKEQVDMFHINKQSCYLLGRDRMVADIPIEHPSTSKQHAVIQYRQVYERNEFGDERSLTKPFIIDLESANGTTVNDDKLPESRFYELRSGDVIKFAFSTREYVILVES